MSKYTSADLCRSLENVKKWGRATLPEEEKNLRIQIVSEEELFRLGFIDFNGPDTDERDAPARLTEAGITKLAELQRRGGS